MNFPIFAEAIYFSCFFITNFILLSTDIISCFPSSDYCVPSSYWQQFTYNILTPFSFLNKTHRFPATAYVIVITEILIPNTRCCMPGSMFKILKVFLASTSGPSHVCMSVGITDP